jgi:hypothetical protein
MYRLALRTIASVSLLLGTTALARPLQAQQDVRVGQTVEGRLGSADPRLSDGSHFHLWTFTARCGERVRVILRSNDFDAFLSVGLLTGDWCDPESCTTDDDSAGGTDSRVDFTPPADGRYTIRVNSLGASETGAYTLSLQEAVVVPPPPAQQLRVGQTVSGSLDSTDPEMGDGSYYDLYRVTLRAGETIVVTLRSSAFDAYLSVGRMVGGEFEEGDSDDGGAGGTDARVTLVAAEAGEYYIRANSLGGGQTGSYTLELAPAR